MCSDRVLITIIEINCLWQVIDKIKFLFGRFFVYPFMCKVIYIDRSIRGYFFVCVVEYYPIFSGLVDCFLE
jgi:hypothetical protein